MEVSAILKKTFGYDAFRPGQKDLIDLVLSGKDTLGVLPTGAGKSLCYQLPSMMLPKPTLVISPLIALMKDQLEGLPQELRARASLINSSLDAGELQEVKRMIASGEKTLLFAAPERLRQKSFLNLLSTIGMSLMVVDEAHCVSAWGHDFRPDYLFIRKSLEALAEYDIRPTLLALTATATPEIQLDISEQLGRPLHVVQGELFRPNLQFEVKRCPNADDKTEKLIALCKESKGATVVYANAKDRCEQLAATLRRKGLSAAHYHAGMTREDRSDTQEAFMEGRTRIIVATIAFGMGIDKADVRMVIHFTLPHSLESYAQEAGRAGRDGKLSRCVLLFAGGDKVSMTRWLNQEEMKIDTIHQTYLALKKQLGSRGSGDVSPEWLLREALGNTSEEWGAESRLRVAVSVLEQVGLVMRHSDAGRNMQIEMLPPPKTTKADTEALLSKRRRISTVRLERVVAYAESKECRHRSLLKHFGSKFDSCKTACDSCLQIDSGYATEKVPPPDSSVIPDVGRVLLETMAALDFSVVRTSLAQAVAGLTTGPLNPGNCANFGKLAGFTRSKAMEFIDQLRQMQLAELAVVREFFVLELTEKGREALRGSETILANPISPPRQKTKIETGIEAEVSLDGPLFEILRRWRKEEAVRLGLPPYLVFHDSMLRAMVSAMPQTIAELALISGVGVRKAELHGVAVLTILKESRKTPG